MIRGHDDERVVECAVVFEELERPSDLRVAPLDLDRVIEQVTANDISIRQVGRHLDVLQALAEPDAGAAFVGAVRTLLSKTTYKFATAQVGLEFGSQRRFVFYVRGGLTYFESSLSGAEITAVAQSKNPDPNNTYNFRGDTKFSGILPCASLGFNLFVY